MSRKSAQIGPEVRSSIRSKIISVVLIGIATTILLTTLANSWREASRYSRVKTAEITATANVFASAASDAVAASDRLAVLKTLRAIGKVPSFAYARVENLKGRTLAELGSAVALKESEELPIVLRSSMSVGVDVVKGGAKVGRLTVLVRTDDLRRNLVAGLLTGLVAAFLSGAIGIVIAFRLQRRITEPLRRLTQTMFEVEQTQRFGEGVVYESDDETGALVRTFNNMIVQIRVRDERLERHREKLEETVDERTRDLKFAKESAEEANAAKSDFLATMSHEIRTPMNGMLVMAELLSSANLSDKHRRYADVVVKSGQSLLTIINDILDFSKIESGKMDLERIGLDPSVVVDDVLNLFWDKASGKGLDLAAYIAPDVPRTVLGDPVRLNQVVSNLVNNALKFTETGSVVVKVVCERKDGTRYLRFSVIDTGIGIAQDKLSAVFESFSQADQTTTRRFGGTGLGLAICKRLVEAMGGAISVASEEGKGSEFFFNIPCEEEACGEDRPFSVNTGYLRNAAVSLADPATAQIISDYIRDCGLQVISVPLADVNAGLLSGCDVVLAAPRTLATLTASDQAESGTPYLVSISQLGDSRTDALVEKGLAHDVIMRPVSRSAMGELVERLGAGRPRGRSLLERRQTRVLPRYPNVRVLVADDSPVNREVILEALKQMEVAADLVENGREAVDAVSRNRYDLIFMDCSMPEMDGFEATRRIREAEQSTGDKIPVIALTAHIAGTSQEDWQRAGMNSYLTKPFRITDLAEVFDEYLDDNRSADLAEPATRCGENSKDLPIIDDAILLEALGCEPGEMDDTVIRMLTLFTNHAPSALLTLAEAAKSETGESIASAAHALKSMASNIGALRLAEACQSLESDAQAGNLEHMVPRLVGLQHEFLAVLDKIKLRKAGSHEHQDCNEGISASKGT